MQRVYLTFDDGPLGGTSKVFNTVKQHNIPASFFMVGVHVAAGPDRRALFNEIKATNGIDVCNHSLTHANDQYQLFYSKPNDVVKDIKDNHDQLHFSNKIVRFPGRNAWKVANISFADLPDCKPARDLVHQQGFDILGWDLEWAQDEVNSSMTNPANLVQAILSAGNTKTQGHVVVLTHDWLFQTDSRIAQLSAIIGILKQNSNIELARISQYPGIA